MFSIRLMLISSHLLLLINLRKSTREKLSAGFSFDLTYTPLTDEAELCIFAISQKISKDNCLHWSLTLFLPSALFAVLLSVLMQIFLLLVSTCKIFNVINRARISVVLQCIVLFVLIMTNLLLTIAAIWYSVASATTMTKSALFSTGTCRIGKWLSLNFL